MDVSNCKAYMEKKILKNGSGWLFLWLLALRGARRSAAAAAAALPARCDRTGGTNPRELSGSPSWDTQGCLSGDTPDPLRARSGEQTERSDG